MLWEEGVESLPVITIDTVFVGYVTVNCTKLIYMCSVSGWLMG